MARPALASVEDLERLLAEDIDGDASTEQAEARLEQASELVRAYAGTDWLNADESDVEGVPGAIPGVVVGIVERASRNPSGTVSESAGPYSRSFGSEAAARIYLTAGDKMIIRHAVGNVSGLSVISTTRGPIETGDCPGWLGFEDTVENLDPYRLWPT